MRNSIQVALFVAGLTVAGVPSGYANAAPEKGPGDAAGGSAPLRIDLGPRPHFLVSQMRPGPLRDQLAACANGPFERTDFSIGHRGAPLMFPEHTRESYEAAARMGAGVVECDVVFTADRELVCRHAQCDLHRTSNILERPELAAKCSEPFTPADPENGTPASARCCTSDITLAEFRSLCGKMDGENTAARTAAEYLRGTPAWRTDLYAGCGTMMSLNDSIELFESLGVKHTPELKTPDVAMPFGDYTQRDHRSALIDAYVAADVPPSRVWAQSFELEDVRFWLEEFPRYGQQAVWLDGRWRTPGFNPANVDALQPSMEALTRMGVKIIAPPMWMLLTADDDAIAPSQYARAARAAGLDIIAWSLERSGRLRQEVIDGGGSNFYYLTTLGAIRGDGDIMTTLDVLARRVGIRGIFSDWPATATYYANCMGR